jgi:hypothetical protein
MAVRRLGLERPTFAHPIAPRAGTRFALRRPSLSGTFAV